MAPEVVAGDGGKISKSVDIWAVGVIMFQLLSGGSHPYFITVQETHREFQKKIKSLTYDDNVLQDCMFLSAISKNLLERLIQVDRTLRYTAQDALQHPWITRQKQNRIPQNLVDQMQSIAFEKKLRRKFNLAHFLAIQKLFSKAQQQPQPQAETAATSEALNKESETAVQP